MKAELPKNGAKLSGRMRDRLLLSAADDLRQAQTERNNLVRVLRGVLRMVGPQKVALAEMMNGKGEVEMREVGSEGELLVQIKPEASNDVETLAAADANPGPQA